MDNKEAMQYLIGLSAPNFREYNGMLLSDKQMFEVTPQPKPIKALNPDKIEIHTLSGLVELLKADECRDKPMMYVLVESPSEVSVVTDPRTDATRATLFTADAILPKIIYESFIDQEAMIVMLRSRFVQTEDTVALISLIGSIKEKTVKQTNDDGISQSVVAKTGIGTVNNVSVNPIQRLRPFRTFVEVEQPESEFLFRLQAGKQEGAGPTMAIFEADGGAWRNTATKTVAEYLTEKLSEHLNIKVIQ